MNLTSVIKIWDILHLKDTGALGYCDLEDAIEKIMGINNDVPQSQPVQKDGRLEAAIAAICEADRYKSGIKDILIDAFTAYHNSPDPEVRVSVDKMFLGMVESGEAMTKWAKSVNSTPPKKFKEGDWIVYDWVTLNDFAPHKILFIGADGWGSLHGVEVRRDLRQFRHATDKEKYRKGALVKYVDGEVEIMARLSVGVNDDGDDGGDDGRTSMGLPCKAESFVHLDVLVEDLTLIKAAP